MGKDKSTTKPKRKNKKKVKKEGSNPDGRPVFVISEENWQIISGLCKIQCTHEEIAKIIGCDLDTLHAATKRQLQKTFSEYFDQKSTNGLSSLRRKQWKSAVEDGNPTMLIWLGKQYLKQQDQSKLELTTPPELKLTLSR